jgi:hypothetical protein
MSSQIACAYKLTAVGARPVASLQAAMAAVPVDLLLPNLYGLLYVGDATILSGQTVTRTMRFSLVPSSNAIASTTLIPGDGSGSPLESVVVQSSGDGYARAPLVTFAPSATPDRPANARCRMQLGNPLIIAGGTGYTGTPPVTFMGGELWPGGIQATGHVTLSGTAISGLIIDTQGGPYGIPPTVIIGGTGSGAIVTAPLSVAGFDLLDPGLGYPGSLESPPSVVLTPVFQSFFPDASNNQASSLAEFMRSTFQYYLQTPVLASLPVVS